MIYCLKPTLDPDSVELTINNIETYITNLKGKIIKTEKLGRKRLAFDVKKFRDGFYSSTYFELDSQKVKALKRNLKLNENVIREMIINVEKPEFLQSTTPTTTQQEPKVEVKVIEPSMAEAIGEK